VSWTSPAPSQGSERSVWVLGDVVGGQLQGPGIDLIRDSVGSAAVDTSGSLNSMANSQTFRPQKYPTFVAMGGGQGQQIKLLSLLVSSVFAL
jgi:hypothetical protein